MSVDVLGLGENSIDVVYRIPTYPQPAGQVSKVRATAQIVVPGGQVATTLAMCGTLGLSTSYVGAFGSDTYGERIMREMAARGIDVSNARVHGVANRHAVILIDGRTGERVVVWHRDAALALRPGDVDPDLVRGCRLLHVDGVDAEASLHAARVARAAGIPVTCDIDTASEAMAALIEEVTIPILAEHVPAAVTGQADLEGALRMLRRPHHALMCVTRGARGAMLLADDQCLSVPAYPVTVVDSTGAGDVFRGAFIHAYLRGDRPEQMLRFANAAAAISCTKVGAMEGVPRVDEVEKLVMGN